MSTQAYKNVASAAVNPKDLAYMDEDKKSKKPIEVKMTIKFDGIYRPLCTTCGHSITSHGEMNGRLFCWSCVAVRQTCLAETGEKFAYGHCVK